MAGGGGQGGHIGKPHPAGQHPGPGQMEPVGHHQHPFGHVMPQLLQKGPGEAEILQGIAGLVLQKNPAFVDAVPGQVVVHALGLGHVLVVPLAAGDHHGHIRVAGQIVQGGVQPVLKEQRRPPGLHLAPQDNHELGLPMELVPLSAANQPRQHGEAHHPRQHHNQQRPQPEAPQSARVGPVSALVFHAWASSSSAARASHLR